MIANTGKELSDLELECQFIEHRIGAGEPPYGPARLTPGKEVLHPSGRFARCCWRHHRHTRLRIVPNPRSGLSDALRLCGTDRADPTCLAGPTGLGAPTGLGGPTYRGRS